MPKPIWKPIYLLYINPLHKRLHSPVPSEDTRYRYEIQPQLQLQMRMRRYSDRPAAKFCHSPPVETDIPELRCAPLLLPGSRLWNSEHLPAIPRVDLTWFWTKARQGKEAQLQWVSDSITSTLYSLCCLKISHLCKWIMCVLSVCLCPFFFFFSQ